MSEHQPVTPAVTGEAESAAEADLDLDPSVDPSQASTASVAASREGSGPSLPDDRESLGRLVRETWVAYVRKQVKDPKPSWTAPWDDLDDFQREVDMRIGHAVASYALTENAATYDLACPRCAGFLDRAYDEHERAEAAEAKLAGLRAVLLEGGQDAATARRRALAVIGSEEEAGRGGDYDVWGADFGTVGGKG